jgi:hypothetical protein
MLSFSFILDEQSMHARNLAYTGGIEEEEFERARELKLVENHLDYYSKFRWNCQQVRQKRALLTPVTEVAIPNLASILRQAFAAECGLVAFGD